MLGSLQKESKETILSIHKYDRSLAGASTNVDVKVCLSCIIRRLVSAVHARLTSACVSNPTHAIRAASLAGYCDSLEKSPIFSRIESAVITWPSCSKGVTNQTLKSSSISTMFGRPKFGLDTNSQNKVVLRTNAREGPIGNNLKRPIPGQRN